MSLVCLVYDKGSNDSVGTLQQALKGCGLTVEPECVESSSASWAVLNEERLQEASVVVVVWSEELAKTRRVVVAAVESFEAGTLVQLCASATTKAPFALRDQEALVLGDHTHERIVTAICEANEHGRLITPTGRSAVLRRLLALARDSYVRAVEEVHLEAEDFARDLVAAPGEVPIGPMTEGVKVLLANRAFEAVALVADTWLWTHHGAPEPPTVGLRISLAQAHIELGRLGLALAVLDRALWMRSPEWGLFRDIRGLRGRIFKQAWVRMEEGGLEQLRTARDAYCAGLQRVPVHLDDYVGINAIAMQAALTRLGDPEPAFDAAAMARAMTEQLKRNPEDPWWHATMGEAHVALGEWKKAVEYYGAYVSHPRVPPFNIASTVRQLREVWKLDPKEREQRELLDLLMGGTLARTGSVTRLTPDLGGSAPTPLGWNDRYLRGDGFPDGSPQSAEDVAMEAIVGSHRARPIRWLMVALERARAVAKIRTTARTLGTGFVVRACDIWKGADEHGRLLLTNAHVVSAGQAHAHIELLGFQASAIRPTAPELARVCFEFGWKGAETELQGCALLWEQPAALLDAALLRVPGLSYPGAPFVPLATHMPPLFVPGYQGRRRRSRVFVIGHPEGQEMHVNVEDGKLWARGPKRALGDEFQHLDYLHYESPTLRGNSGSPVFEEENWSVVALHHMGGVPRMGSNGRGTMRERMANEGVSILSILDAIRQEIPTAPECA